MAEIIFISRIRETSLSQHSFFNALQRIRVRYFYIKNNQLIILFIIYLINIIIFNFSIYKRLLKKKKVIPKLRQEVKVKVDIVTSDDIKIYYTGKFQDFTARYIIILLMALTI